MAMSFAGGGHAARNMGNFNKNIPLQDVDNYKGVNLVILLGFIGFFTIIGSLFFIDISLFVFVGLSIIGIICIALSIILPKILRKKSNDEKAKSS